MKQLICCTRSAFPLGSVLLIAALLVASLRLSAQSNSELAFHRIILPQSPNHTVGRMAQTNENDNGLNDEFALENGPRFVLPPQQQALVDKVIEEMKKGYGGTLVTKAGPDNTLDSSSFLSRYLREFSSLENKHGLKDYDYRFERILERASEYPTMLDDPRLDWDIYRSLVLYEQFSDGTDRYEDKTGNKAANYELDSAKDLAWMYIERHSDGLMRNKDRRRWWVDHLVRGLNTPSGSRVNRWFLLQLCLLADPNRTQMFPSAPDDGRKMRMREPSQDNPFFVVQANTKRLAFKDALHAIAGPLGLSFEVWGIDPEKMPPARILTVSLEIAKWPTDRSHIIGQESWSNPKAGTLEYGVQFFHILGQRAPYSNVSIPHDRKDGVFFLSFNKRLYVWSKAEMNCGVLQMAKIAGLIDDATWTQLASTHGLHRLKTTLTGQ